MINKAVISTEAAPVAIGSYSQAVKVGNTVYLSGQIGLDPTTMRLVSDEFSTQADQVLKNLRAVCEAANGSLSDVVKLTVYLTSLDDFDEFNRIMALHFRAPYPARAALGVKALPKGAVIEVDGIAVV